MTVPMEDVAPDLEERSTASHSDDDNSPEEPEQEDFVLATDFIDDNMAQPTDKQLRSIARQGRKQFGNASTLSEHEVLFKDYEDFSFVVHKDKQVKPSRVFQWLTFHANREKRKQFIDVPVLDDCGEPCLNNNGEPRFKRTKAPKCRFDLAECTALMAELTNQSFSKEAGEALRAEDLAIPRLQTLDKHCSAIMKNCPDHMKQKLRDHQGISDLKAFVTARHKTMDEMACKEKVDPQLEKFKCPALYPKLEEHFWDKHSSHNSWSKIASALRDRFTLNCTVQTIVRFDTIIKCKLSNHQILHVQLKDELDTYPILFRNINVLKNDQADTGKRTIVQAKSLHHMSR